MNMNERLTEKSMEALQAAQRLAAKGDLSGLRVGSININPGAKPQGIGVDAARGIGREMKK